MVGVWLSGVFIFAGDNKYDSVKSNYQLKELFFILIMTAFTKSTKPCKRVTTIPNQLFGTNYFVQERSRNEHNEMNNSSTTLSIDNLATHIFDPKATSLLWLCQNLLIVT